MASKTISRFPVRFSGLSGQAKAKKMLARSIVSGRLAHGYLFKGPDGVGKRLFGRALAASVNCRSRQGAEACDQCPSCRKYFSGNHPDFVVISPEKGTIKINTIREMQKSLSYPPYESAMRVILIEDIHTMREAAANALLKTLEEPPENNLLILTAESTREVLATIHSRCQVIPFFHLSVEETRTILLKEDSGLDHDDAELLARLSEGSPGRALFYQRMEMIDILQKVVTILADPAFEADGRVGHVLETAGFMADLNEHLAPFLGLLRLWVKDLLLVSTARSDAQLERLCFDYGKSLKGSERWKSWTTEQLFFKLQLIDRAEQELNRNCNRPLVCEVLLFQLQKR